MNSDTRLQRPHKDSYVVPNTLLSAGAYPGSPPTTSAVIAVQKLQGFIDAGVRVFVDLTAEADGLNPYAPALSELNADGQTEYLYESLPIRDMGTCDVPHMRRVLDIMDAHMVEGRPVYVHCWGGIGRTGMVIGCWLVRHGRSGEAALKEVDTMFRTMSAPTVARHSSWGSPQTDEQRNVVRTWVENEEQPVQAGVPPTINDVWELIAPRKDMRLEVRDRMRGALIGLAVGDAVGTTVEFKRPGSFPPVTDMLGGGPFGLAAGEWTDDTSMALCLAESLIEKRGFDARDQMERYVMWKRDGHLSSNGRCFDIGITVRQALDAFVKTGEPFSGSTDTNKAGNGSLMRLAPIPMFFSGRGVDVIAMAADSSRTTHATAVAVDACRYFAALIVGALHGAKKSELLSAHFSPIAGYWDTNALDPIIAAIANGSYKQKAPPAIKGTGYSADALEAALWAFHNSENFRDGCLLAVNLGDDADTTAAIYGQLAGAFYGESQIPAEWRSKLAKKPLLDRYAELLFQLSFGGPPHMESRTESIKAEAARLVQEAGGDAVKVLRELIADEAEAKREMGTAYFGGPMHAQTSRDELQLQLRVAVGAAVARAKAL